MDGRAGFTHLFVQVTNIMFLTSSATSEWIQFFKDAGIPAGLAVTYAVSFVDNR